jgi:hypothetical protein
MVVVRPYKTRTAFTNLVSTPPTIYLNEYLIDDEEVVEYLILREMIHIKLNMYPPMRYTGGLSYAEKFDSALNFFIPKEKIEEIREKMVKKLIEVKNSVNNLFFLFHVHSGAATCSATSLRRDVVGKEEEKEAYPPAGFSSQEFPYRDNYPCKSVPVSLYL